MRAGIVVTLALMAAVCARADIVTQTSEEDGVTVAVTAGNLSTQTPVWDFAVVLSSARGSLPDDLVQDAVLVDPDGREYKPLVWEGAPEAGEHRGGVLKFFAVEPRPQSVELRIRRPGEHKARSFSWFLSTGLVALR
jgi:hypothetical protein